MTSYCMDASALVIYVTGEKSKVDLKKIFRGIESGKSRGVISTVNLSEFHRAVSRLASSDKADMYTTWLKESRIEICSPTVETAVLASTKKQKYASKESPFAWGDAFCLAVGLEQKADYLVTADPDFEKVKEIAVEFC